MARAGDPDEAAAATPSPDEPEVDPDRLLRQRLAFAFVTALVGAFTLLISFATLPIVFSGRVSLPIAFAALLLTASCVLLVLRGALRAAISLRPDNSEVRSLAGFVSLACGLLLLCACGVLLFLTFSVVLSTGGSTALFILPLGVVAYLTLGFSREATADFRRKTFPRGELRLFLLSILYFSASILVASLLFAASVAAPITLRSPADGSTLCAGTLLDFDVVDPSVSSVSWSTGPLSGPLPAPYDLNTTAWPPGPTTLTLTALDPTGASANVTFHFTLAATSPPCP